ncbi:MAG: DVU0298 family protein, partial [Desulfatiglandales bacterium]
MSKTRELKEALKRALSQKEFQPSHIDPLLEDPDTLVGPLFSFLPQTEKFLRWHAITSLGLVVEEISKRDLEGARVILRKLMWNLNDESGGIGWGCAEAMGEILSRVRPLAMEFSTILVSYIHEEENFLEQIPLIEGALWGIARASQTNPDTLKR